MLALIAALAAQASLTCESVRAVAPDARCTATAGGLVLTEEADAAQAPRLVEAAAAATERALASIAQAIASGGTFEAWLAANGAAKRLPTTVPALQSAFVAWLPGYIGRNGVPQRHRC